MNLKLIGPEETILLWSSKLEKIFMEILSSSRPDDSLVNVLRNLLNGKLKLWCFYNDEYKICGIATTQVIVGDLETSLKIDHVWANKKYVNPFKETIKGMKFMEEYAKTLGCDNVKCYSTRGSKYFTMMGFTPSYTEYIKEIKNESV